MGRKEGNPYADTEFVRAFHVELAELEQAYGVMVESRIETATRPDRVIIKLVAWKRNPAGGRDTALCSYSTDWPNATPKSFPVALFQSAIQLTRLVQDHSIDLGKRGAPRR